MIPVKATGNGEVWIVRIRVTGISYESIYPVLVCGQPGWIEVGDNTGSVHKVRPVEVMIVVISVSKIVPTVSCDVRGRSWIIVSESALPIRGDMVSLETCLQSSPSQDMSPGSRSAAEEEIRTPKIRTYDATPLRFIHEWVNLSVVREKFVSFLKLRQASLSSRDVSG